MTVIDDADGSPVEGATVTLEDKKYPKTGTTDEKGYTKLLKVKDKNKATIAVQKEGYETLVLTKAVKRGQILKLEVRLVKK